MLGLLQIVQKWGKEEESNSRNLKGVICSLARNLIQIPAVPVLPLEQHKHNYAWPQSRPQGSSAIKINTYLKQQQPPDASSIKWKWLWKERMYQQSIDVTCRLLAMAAKWWRFQETSCRQSPFVLINTSGHTTLRVNYEDLPSLNVISFLYVFLKVVSPWTHLLVRMLAQHELESCYMQLCSEPWWTKRTRSDPSHLFYYTASCKCLVLPALSILSPTFHSLSRNSTQVT